ncbi:hypothetical protein GCM10010207_75580 [Streptomyces atratus]|nr:hypothetical protein GCM10010207_75580 [Streptomyces atratus]
MKLRVIEPENTFWRRGIQTAARYVKETGAVQLRDTVVFIVFTAVARSPWRRSGLPLRFGGCASAVAA